MDLTGDLFANYEQPRARKRDPETSHKAAERVQDFAAGHFALILETLKRFGPLTIDELSARSALDKWAVARRLPELERAGSVRVLQRDGRDVTRPGTSMRQQRVWEVV